MRTRLLLATAMLALAVCFLVMTRLGVAYHSLLPIHGASFGSIQILELVD
jgi:hypothetical protein